MQTGIIVLAVGVFVYYYSIKPIKDSENKFDTEVQTGKIPGDEFDPNNRGVNATKNFIKNKVSWKSNSEFKSKGSGIRAPMERSRNKNSKNVKGDIVF